MIRTRIAFIGLALFACAPRLAPTVPPVAARPPYTAADLASAVEIEDLAVKEDGSELAFTSNRSGAFELWTLDLQSPATPVQRTRFGEHVTGPVYSPDGKYLVFECDKGGDERTDLWMLAMLGSSKAGEAEPIRLTNTEATEHHAAWFRQRGTTEIVFESDARERDRFDVAAMGVEEKIPHLEIVAKDRNLRSPFWTEDDFIVATETGDDQQGDLLFDERPRPADRVRAPFGGIVWMVDSLSPHQQLVLMTNRAGFQQMGIATAYEKKIIPLGPGDWDVEQARGTLVSSPVLIAFSRNIRGESALSAITAKDEQTLPRTLPGGGVIDRLAIDSRADRVFILREESNHPAEVSVVDVKSGAAQTLVAADLGHIDPAQLSKAERREFKSFDGVSIDAWITKPKIPRLGSPPPLVVLVHGGPDSQARPGFYPMVQSLAEAGFVVAQPNYRGSSGYGRVFLDLNNGDWGGGDLKDVLAVVDGLMASKEIDPSRTGITGGSYGGYLTLRAITAAPDRFKAAVEMYGMADLEVDYRLTAGRFGGWYETEMGNPDKNKQLFFDRSPIHFLDRVKAPLLVLQGANDTNVPKSESDQIVAALKARNREVEYVVYPDEGHEFSKRKNRIDSIQRTVEFFVRHLRK